MAPTCPQYAVRALSRTIFVICLAHLIILFTLWTDNIPQKTTVVTAHLCFLLLCLFALAEKIKHIQGAWKSDIEASNSKQNLIENMLPKSIAEKTHLNAIPKEINHVPYATVIFADIVNFTALADQLSSQQLMSLLDTIYTEFDLITQHHGLEKIKTIGDEYMAVSGAPEEKRFHAHAACHCALHLRQRFEFICQQHRIRTHLRIGIHSGPISAGIIGKNKLSYDIWGNTVNYASRLQSQGQSGKIHISHTSFKLVKNAFSFESPKQLNIKGFGLKRTYFLIGNLSHAQLQHPNLSQRLLAKETSRY